MARAMRPRYGFALVACIVLGACSMSSTSHSDGTNTSSPDAEVTTSVPSGSTTVDVDFGAKPDGSGCDRNNPELPDGHWFGFVTYRDSRSATFDLACWFTGDAALVAADADGVSNDTLNGYYVRNQSDLLRVIRIDSETPVSWLERGEPMNGTFADWNVHLQTGEMTSAAWITIKGGDVTSIREQPLP